ncbi:hypothetical protein [Capnocytophaga canimorsus]|uniref:hypothetical protein n=1 Tax=Capnocytophaga canimorsus TaxID=28188 RepID=UPI0037D33B8A
MKDLVKKFREENKGKWMWYNGSMGIDTALANNQIEDTREQAIEAMAWNDNVTTEEVENDYDNWYYILPVEEILDEYLIDYFSQA